MYRLASLNMMSRSVKSICNKFLLVILFSIIADIHYLQDIVVGTKLQRTYIDLNILFQKVLSQLTHLFRPGSTPHQRLSVRLSNQKKKSELSKCTAWITLNFITNQGIRVAAYQVHCIPWYENWQLYTVYKLVTTRTYAVEKIEWSWIKLKHYL